MPNVIVAYWAGDLGHFGQFFVNFNGNVNRFRAKGFKVVTGAYNPHWKSAGSPLDPPSGKIKPTANGSQIDDFENLVEQQSAEGTLHGVYFWGHGSPGGAAWASDIGPVYNNKPIQRMMVYANVHLKHKLALAWMYACYSNTGKGALIADGPNASWVGFNNIMAPIPGGGVDTPFGRVS